MLKTKQFPDDDELPLYPNAEDGFERIIARGAIDKLEKWPSHLLYAFFAGCLVILGLVLFIFVTAAIYLPITVEYRETQIFESSTLPNIYFLKHANKKWHIHDFCYMEAVVREHPELNVYSIDIIKNEASTKNPEVLLTLQNNVENNIGFFEKTRRSLGISNSDIKNTLSTRYSNFRTVEMTIDKFFNGSSLSRNIDSFDDETLEMAAKAYLLWNAPGIILQPDMYCNVKNIREILCEEKEKCKPDELATVDPERDLQATGVPCQAFVGHLIRELSKLSKKESLNHHYTLKDALQVFCEGIEDCREVRVLNLKTKCPFDTLKCPTVYPRFTFV